MARILALITGASVRRAAAEQESPQSVLAFGSWMSYRVTHRVEVQMGQFPLKELEIWIPVPQDQPEQRIQALAIEPRVPVVMDRTGQAKVARLIRRQLSVSRPVPVRLQVTYQADCRSVRLVRDAVLSDSFDAYRIDDTYRRFTASERKIEMHFEPLKAAAEQLLRSAAGPLAFAEAAYDWVLDKTRYQLVDGLKGARFCFNEGYGECGDYSTLFVALCRNAGIPARIVAGAWASGKNGWHCWAEFMLPGGHWVPVDCSLGDRSDGLRNRYFGYLDARRVAFCKTCDVDLEGQRGSRRRADFLQMGNWWWYTDSPVGDLEKPSASFTFEGHRLNSSRE